MIKFYKMDNSPIWDSSLDKVKIEENLKFMSDESDQIIEIKLESLLAPESLKERKIFVNKIF